MNAPVPPGFPPGQDVRVQILLGDANSGDRQLIRQAFASFCLAFELVETESREQFALELATHSFDLVLADPELVRAEGPGAETTAELVRRLAPAIPLVMVTRPESEEAAADALEAGAIDYIVKSPLALRRLPFALRAALENNPTPSPTQEQERESLLLRLLIDHLPEYVYIKDFSGRFLITNQPNLRLLCARTESEVVGKTVFDFFPPALAALYHADDMAIVASGEGIFDREEPFSAPSGLEGCFLTTKLPLRDGEGKVVGLLGFSRDVSERRQIEEAQARLAAIVESSDDAIYSTDLEGRILTWNRSAERLFGYTTKEIIGRPSCLLVPEELQEQEMELEFSGAPATDQRIAHRETWRLHQDGRRVDVAITLSPLRQGTGRVVGTSAIVRDIGERKRTEAELLRLAAAVEQATEIITILDPAGVIQYVNPAFERITGFTRAEVLTQEFSRFHGSDESAQSFEHIRQITLRAGRWTGRLYSRRKDGTRCVEEAAISPIQDAAGQLVHFIAVNRDITKEAALEEQVRLAQKMEAIGLLAGGVAHDFNNLLQIIQGYSLLVLDSISEQDANHGNLMEVTKATARATQLTRQLLTFGRRQNLLKADTDLNQLLSELLKMIRRLIGQHIEVEFIPGCNLSPLQVDKGQLEQVLLNLCINARDAMPDGGRISIQVKNVTLEGSWRDTHPWAKPGRYVQLSVRDTGAGMDPETLRRIFEPFFTTKPKEQGTGLGLSVAYGIIQQHDGLINVTSHPGNGTTFDVYLPVTETVVCPEPPAPSLQPPRGDETILLAEDEPQVRDLALRILHGAGYQVIVAQDGEEMVLQYVENSERIQMLVCDVVMPRMGGRQAYERIRALNPAIPVLFCSGYSGSALQSGYAPQEGFPLLQKPYSAEALLTRIRQLLDQGRAGADREGIGDR